MKYTTKYLGVDKVVYEFDENDVREALMEKFKIKKAGLENDYNRTIEFDAWHDDNSGLLVATMTVYYSKEADPKEAT